MTSTDREELRPRVRIAVAPVVTTAEEWYDALDAAGIDALVEIDDERNAMPGRNPLTGIGWAPTSFVYAVSVPLEDRERAAAVLIDHGWDGGIGSRGGRVVSTSTRLKGALAAVAVAFAFAILWLWVN